MKEIMGGGAFSRQNIQDLNDNFAELSEGRDMRLDVFIHQSPDPAIKELQQQVSEVQTIVKEIRKTMPSIQDVKDAVKVAAQQVVDAVKAAVTKETGEVVEQIKVILGNTNISEADKQEIVDSVLGISDAASKAIDTVSDNDGAVPTPPPPPPLP